MAVNLPLGCLCLCDVPDHANAANVSVVGVSHGERRHTESHSAVVTRAFVIAQRPIEYAGRQFIRGRSKKLRELRYGGTFDRYFRSRKDPAGAMIADPYDAFVVDE